ncbi:hypothetical protein GCM10023333_13090 [Ferrimonas pelagia]|uniref:Secreted protein n=1 Tax=Ferrimonas pelagia TaxID=1177826 RepID=A0ABP9ESZ5_9GAMM
MRLMSVAVLMVVIMGVMSWRVLMVLRMTVMGRLVGALSTECAGVRGLGGRMGMMIVLMFATARGQGQSAGNGQCN